MCSSDLIFQFTTELYPSVCLSIHFSVLVQCPINISMCPSRQHCFVYVCLCDVLGWVCVGVFPFLLVHSQTAHTHTQTLVWSVMCRGLSGKIRLQTGTANYATTAVMCLINISTPDTHTFSPCQVPFRETDNGFKEEL